MVALDSRSSLHPSRGWLYGLAASVVVLAHVILASLFLRAFAFTAPEPSAPIVEAAILVMLPPQAPEVPVEEVIAPTPSVAAPRVQQKPEPPRPRPSPVEAPAHPPQPDAPPVTIRGSMAPPTASPPMTDAPPAPAEQEATVASAPVAPPLAPSPSLARAGQDTWESRVMARLERFRRYPNAARARRQQGVAYVRVSLARDGSVLALSLEQSSGVPQLDEAALETFRRAAPLPAVEDDRPTPVQLSIPVEFFLR